MKFRAKAVDRSFVRTFAQLVSALSRCSRSFVLRITTDKLIFVLSDKEAVNGACSVSAWGEVPKDPYFCEYQMEGVSPESNEIYLEIQPDKIAQCLGSLRSSQNVVGLKIKLTKKVVPCLTFEIEFQSTNSAPTCIHDVPVNLVFRRFWNHYQDPTVPTLDISVGLPDLRSCRLAIERMKNIGSKLHINASSDGKLTFSVNNIDISCTVNFNDVRVLNLEGSPEDESQRNFSVDVDMKTMLGLISTDMTKPSTFLISLSNARTLHMYFLYGDISLQYCLPSVSMD